MDVMGWMDGWMNVIGWGGVRGVCACVLTLTGGVLVCAWKEYGSMGVGSRE